MKTPESNKADEWIVKPIRADYITMARRKLVAVLQQEFHEKNPEKYNQIDESDFKPVTQLPDNFRETREFIYYGFEYTRTNKANIYTIRFNKKNNGEPIFEVHPSLDPPVRRII